MTLIPTLAVPTALVDPAGQNRLRLKGQRQRLAGILFTLTGLGLVVGSAISFARCCDAQATGDPVVDAAAVEDARMRIITGAVLAGSSLVSLIAGLGLWSVGQYNIGRANRGESLSVLPVLRAGPAGALGAGLGWKF